MRHLICTILLCLSAPLALAALDLNTATEAELDALTGVGPSRAQAIIEHRKANGPFTSVDDLRNVKGIGDKTLAELKPLLAVGRSPAAGTAASPSAVASAETSAGGFPWWLLIVGAVAAVLAFVFMRRRSAPASAPAQADASAAPPASTPAPPPRPAAASPPAPSSPPARPAGAPPRPAGSPVSAASPVAGADVASTAKPKPAGAPPKPAGSR